MRIAVFASGGGSNLQALLDYFATNRGRNSGEIALVVSNRDDSGALARAKHAGVDTFVVRNPADANALLDALQQARIELLVLAGYLKLVPTDVVRAFHGRTLNVHPALLPAYGGTGMYGHRVHEAVLADGTQITGVTVHFVDEHYDRGAVIAQWPVPVLPGDSAHSLAARVLAVEHQLLPLIVDAVAACRIELGADGRAHGHLDALLLPTAPDFLFALMPASADHARDTFALDVARLFPR